MRKRKYYPGVLALAAALTVVSAGIGKTWSYFTAYAEAAGGYTIRLGDRTEITEKFSGWTKQVTITSDEGSEPVYVRAKAFCGSQYSIMYSGEGWTLNSDGYYYYDSIVYGGGAAAVLNLKIEGIPQDPEEEERFNVVVIYESVPVRYHQDGTPFTVQETDWSEILDTGSDTGEVNSQNTGNAENAGNQDSTGDTGNAESAESQDSTGDTGNVENTENQDSTGDAGNADNNGDTEGGGEA